MEQRLSLVTLGVADLARSRAFYADGLGWRPAPFGGEEVVFFQLGGIALGLWSRTELARDAAVPDRSPGFGGVALAYHTRSRDEVDEILSLAARCGGRVTRPAADTPWGGCNGYFADPDGHLWEVAWNPGFALDAAGNLTLPDTARPG